MNKIIQGISGPYYDHVPDHFHLATVEDYEKGKFTNNRAFLIKWNDKEHYECNRVKFPIKPKILNFIKLNRVFIYEK